MALSRVSTDIYNELNKHKLLDSDVMGHSLSDKDNCSSVIQSAFTTAMTLVQKKAPLDDKSHRESGNILVNGNNSIVKCTMVPLNPSRTGPSIFTPLVGMPRSLSKSRREMG